MGSGQYPHRVFLSLIQGANTAGLRALGLFLSVIIALMLTQGRLVVGTALARPGQR